MKFKKKIRIIIGSLNIGGTEKQVVEIVNNLANRGWKIEIITIIEKGKLSKKLNKKINIHNLNIKKNYKLIMFYKIIFNLYKIFKKNPYTLTHFFLPQAYILGMLSAIIARTKCNLIMSRRSLNYYQKKILFCRLIEKFLHKKMNKIFVNSLSIKNQLIKDENVKNKKIKLIYNGIKIKKKNKIKSKKNFNIILLANLIKYKNHKMLFSALNLIKNKLKKNWKLYCIGRDDGIKKDLIKFSKKLKIDKKIIWKESENVKNILKRGNLGILCSNEEGCPNAILEYLSFNLPVISTKVGGCSEIIKNNKNGILVKKNNYKELSKAILYIYKNKKFSEKISNKGFKTAKNKFNLKKTIDAHENEYLKYVKT